MPSYRLEPSNRASYVLLNGLDGNPAPLERVGHGTCHIAACEGIKYKISSKCEQLDEEFRDLGGHTRRLEAKAMIAAVIHVGIARSGV